MPRKKARWVPGYRFIDNRGVPCAVQRTRKRKGRKRGLAAYAHAHIVKPSAIGRKTGDRFQFNGQRFKVVRVRTRKGGYRKAVRPTSK